MLPWGEKPYLKAPHSMLLPCSDSGADKLPELDSGDFAALLKKQALLAHGRKLTLLSFKTSVEAMLMLPENDPNRNLVFGIVKDLLNEDKMSDKIRKINEKFVSNGKFVGSGGVIQF